MRFFRALTERHQSNKEALATNNKIVETAEEQSQIVKAIAEDVDSRAQRLRQANRRNHYSEGLTKSFQGRTT